MGGTLVTVTKQQSGTATVFKLDGSVDELFKPDEQLGPPPPEMVIYCKGIKSINSVGVKGWIKYFKKAAKGGSKLVFRECSSAIVQQLSMIPDMAAGGVVESIYVPFACSKCHSELQALYSTADLIKSGCQIAPMKCSRCSGEAVFDDIPDEYFNFLT